MIKRPYVYTKTLVLGDELLSDFHNDFRVIDRVFRTSDKLGSYARVTLQVLHDDRDPGVDKDGNAEWDNVGATFEVDVLDVDACRKLRRGERVALDGFVAEKSYFIDFNLILRFRSLRALPAQERGKAA